MCFLTVQIETMSESERITRLSDAIGLIPDFPSPGVLFRFDFTDFVSMLHICTCLLPKLIT